MTTNPPIIDKSSIRTQRLLVYFREKVAVEIVFGRNKDKEKARNALVRSLKGKEWVRIARAKKVAEEEEKKKRSFDPTRVGIGGVIRSAEREVTKREVQISRGFKDLDSLMETARELVVIANRFKDASGRDGGGVESGVEKNVFVDMMNELGIESPVTKEAMGGNAKLYRTQLARQLGEFLVVTLEQVGGLMTLTDVYCAYNRGRASTELVSPDDLVAACNLFGTLKLGLRLVRLESGVNAVELSGARKEVGAKRLRKLAEERGTLSAVELMGEMSIPVQRILAMLYDAEQRGLLCRDETESGLRFFPNEFLRGVW